MRALCLVLLLLCSSAARAQDVVNGALGAEIDRAIRASTLGQFWGAILVVRDGEIIIAKGYGVANESLDPVTAHSLFDIASITKCFTAAALVRLEQDGKLSIDDPITRFYPAAGESKKNITLRHFLTHTSGLDPEGAENAYAKGDLRDSVAEGLLKAERLNEPGVVFRYSNAGYFILAAVIEKASGTTWERYVTDTILHPAGMKLAGCCGDPSLDKKLLTARQDRQWRIDGDAATWPYPLTWGYRGAGGVVASVMDLYAWDRALRTDNVLSAPSREKMYTPALEGYALGWDVEDTPEGRVASHTGGVRGYACSFSRWLDRDTCLAVLTNERHNPVAISKLLTEHLFPHTRETTSFTAHLAGYHLGEHAMVAYPDALTLETLPRAEEGGVQIVAKDPSKETPAITIDLSAGAAAAFISKLETAIKGVKARGADPDAKGMRIEVYTQVYRLQKDQPLERAGEGVTLEAKAGVMHQEEGGNKKVLVFIRDEPRHMLPMFMKLERGSAEELLASLKAATRRN